MATRPRNRVVHFDVVDDHLEMKVCFPDAPKRNYVHRCTRDIFREVAYTIEENAAGGMTLEDPAAAAARLLPDHLLGPARAGPRQEACGGCDHRLDRGDTHRRGAQCAASQQATRW
jgi:hypothetical protein